MTGEMAKNRKIIQITGADRLDFLQGLVSNNIGKATDGLIYAALLSPQGKYLADFFLCHQADAVLLDVHSDLVDGLLRRLTMYKLRADVTLALTDITVKRGLGPVPDGALADPRHDDMGWRLYSETVGQTPSIDWDAIRVRLCIPETGIELRPDETYILEAGFERLKGVDFRKGCYVGQEITARMKHKTELRKGFVTVSISGSAPVGTAILSDGKPAGTLFTQAGNQAIAYLRFDRMADDMQAGAARISPLK